MLSPFQEPGIVTRQSTRFVGPFGAKEGIYPALAHSKWKAWSPLKCQFSCWLWWHPIGRMPLEYFLWKVLDLQRRRRFNFSSLADLHTDVKTSKKIQTLSNTEYAVSLWYRFSPAGVSSADTACAPRFTRPRSACQGCRHLLHDASRDGAAVDVGTNLELLKIRANRKNRTRRAETGTHGWTSPL